MAVGFVGSVPRLRQRRARPPRDLPGSSRSWRGIHEMKIAVPNVGSIKSSPFCNAPVRRFVTIHGRRIAVPRGFCARNSTRMAYNRTIEGGRHRLVDIAVGGGEQVPISQSAAGAHHAPRRRRYELAFNLPNKLTAAQTVPAALSAYQEWLSEWMSMVSETAATSSPIAARSWTGA